MTQDQFEAKYDQLVAQVAEFLKKDGRHLFRSGGVNPPDYPDDFRLPFIVLSAALGDAKFQFEPNLARDKKAAKNLSHF